jgi:hypothetical protein
MRQKRLNILRAQIFRVSLVMEVDIAFNPIHIALLGADRIVLHPQLVAHLVKQFWGLCHVVFI